MTTLRCPRCRTTNIYLGPGPFKCEGGHAFYTLPNALLDLGPPEG